MHDIDPLTKPSADFIEEVVELTDLINVLENHLGNLRKRRRRLYRARWLYDVSLRSISNAVGCSHQAVTAEIIRARAEDEAEWQESYA